MLGPDRLQVTTEESRLDTLGAHEVVVDGEQLAVEDLAVLRHFLLETGQGAGLRVASEEQVQHRHEVRLTGAEGAVDECASRARVLEG